MSYRFPILSLLPLGVGIALAPRLCACGPDFPNAYLTNSLDELEVLPTFSFERELQRLFPDAPVRPVKVDDDALEANEREEIRGALRTTGVPATEIDRLVSAYHRDAPPPDLPMEFQLYARGAAAWHAGQKDVAIAAWRALLALPPRERHYRSVWAAYMIGRAYVDAQPDEARAMCELTRQLAREGFADSQGLAISSLGWQARALLRQNDCAGALCLYVAQYRVGVPSARASIQLTLARLFRGIDDSADRAANDGCADASSGGDSALGQIAANTELRAVVTAWFASRGGPALPWGRGAAREFARWIRALPQAPDLSPEEADRWCWAAYQNGQWENAAALAGHAPADAPAAEWVRAMLLLRRGFVAEAATHLARAARDFATDPALSATMTPEDENEYEHVEGQPLGEAPTVQLAGVRGVLALRREHYTEALRILLDAEHWADAAYVAERVLTLDELIAFVRTDSPRVHAARGDYDRYAPALDLRHLLARRLVRAGRFDAATEFFPEKLRPIYTQ